MAHLIHTDVIHLDAVRFDECDIPHPQPPEMLHLVPANKMWSVDGNDYFKINYPCYVASMTAFLSRLHGYARHSQVKISDNARVTGVIIEDN